MGSDHRTYSDEIAEFEKAIEWFSDAMLKKLIRKMIEGYTGWNDWDMRNEIRERLREHIEGNLADGENLVDIANLSMMLAYLNLTRGVPQDVNGLKGQLT